MEEHNRLYAPNLMEAVRGEAEGAAEALAKSKYADALTDYEKVVFINNHGYKGKPPIEDCSCIALLPPATADGKLIVGRNTQSGKGIGNYGVAYAVVPPAPAHRFMVNTMPVCYLVWVSLLILLFTLA
jgi:hypothetical protein